MDISVALRYSPKSISDIYTKSMEQTILPLLYFWLVRIIVASLFLITGSFQNR